MKLLIILPRVFHVIKKKHLLVDKTILSLYKTKTRTDIIRYVILAYLYLTKGKKKFKLTAVLASTIELKFR